jgi:hypothetical protein
VFELNAILAIGTLVEVRGDLSAHRLVEDLVEVGVQLADGVTTISH